MLLFEKDGGAGSPPAIETPVVEPEKIEPPAKPEPTFDPKVERELAFLRKQVSDMAGDLKKKEEALREYELAGLDPDEKLQAEIERKQVELARREQELNEKHARSQWQSYFSEWLPAEERGKVLVGDDPVEWVNGVLTWQKGQMESRDATIKKLTAELNALKEAGTKKPAVAGTSATAGGKDSIFNTPLAKLVELKERARQGRLDPADIPPL